MALAFIILSTMLVGVITKDVFAATQATYYISPTGDDSNSGTLLQPFKTVEYAKNIVRTINNNMTGNIYIYLLGGTYNISQTLSFDESDSGTNGYDVIYSAYNAEVPVISGGVQVIDWTVHSGNIYKADVASGSDFRQLYINGIRGKRASSEIMYTGTGWYDNTSDATLDKDGIYVNDSVVGYYDNASDMELHWTDGNIEWRDVRIPIESIVSGGPAKKIILFKQPQLKQALSLSFDPAKPSYSKSFYIENAYELLDEPREWYLNKSTNTVYYYAQTAEDMSLAKVYAPKVEKLIDLKGSALANKVHNIHFTGLFFIRGCP